MAKRRQRTVRKKQTPGWAWMLFGFALGLVVALGVYLRSQPLSLPGPAAGAVTETAETQPAADSSERPAVAAGERAEADDATRFDFYELLPRFEVIVPEVESVETPGAPAAPVSDPGKYVLQAGSYKNLADADRRKASLALLGIESNIQDVTIERDTFHRVRIGPISDLEALNRIRRRLIDADVETLLIKLPQ